VVYARCIKIWDGRSLNAKTSRLAAISTSRVGQAAGHLPRDNVHTFIYLKMSIITRCPRLKTYVGGLVPKSTKLTLWPTYTRQLLRPRATYRISSIDSPRGIVTKSPRTDGPFEEERLPDYAPEQFYPINIGDTINSRYHVIGKLGFGANSTVWFCRDLLYISRQPTSPLMGSVYPSARHGNYVVLKVYVQTPAGMVNREQAFYNHLQTLSIAHPGSQHIRHAIDQFSLTHTSGAVHECMVHLPLQTTLFAFQRPGGRPRPLPEELVKPVMKYLLEALDFLHTDANVTHCGMEPARMCEMSPLTCII